MKRLGNYVLMLLSASALGTFVSTASGHAEANRLQDEQRACEEALRKNSVKALEQFLRDYRYGNSACRALALNALSGLSNNGDQSNRGEGPRNNGYNR